MASALASTRDLVERTELARDTSSLLYIRRTIATKFKKIYHSLHLAHFLPFDWVTLYVKLKLTVFALQYKRNIRP
jgi:hypothetical protein